MRHGPDNLDEGSLEVLASIEDDIDRDSPAAPVRGLGAQRAGKGDQVGWCRALGVKHYHLLAVYAAHALRLAAAVGDHRDIAQPQCAAGGGEPQSGELFQRAKPPVHRDGDVHRALAQGAQGPDEVLPPYLFGDAGNSQSASRSFRRIDEDVDLTDLASADLDLAYPLDLLEGGLYLLVDQLAERFLAEPGRADRGREYRALRGPRAADPRLLGRAGQGAVDPVCGVAELQIEG